MFVQLKMGLADWDINLTLRQAFINNKKKIKDISKKYDETFELTIKTNTQVNDKYKTLYKLTD